MNNNEAIAAFNTNGDQEAIDKAFQEWKANPVAKRKSMVEKEGASLYDQMILRMLATGEQAAFEAMERGDPAVFFGDPEPCKICHDFVVNAGGVFNTTLRMRVVWMGPKKRWVCEGCMVEQRHIQVTPEDTGMMDAARRNIN